MSIPEWIAEFDRLKKVNGEIMAGKGRSRRQKGMPKSTGKNA
jgi:hypothetical protein